MEAALLEGPLAHGFRNELWTLERVAQVIRRVTGVSIHHADWWKDGGETDVRKGLPLCWRHHAMVTEGGYELVAKASGGFEVVRRLNRSG